jgi:hypothetical protein
MMMIMMIMMMIMMTTPLHNMKYVISHPLALVHPTSLILYYLRATMILTFPPSHQLSPPLLPFTRVSLGYQEGTW